MRSKWRAQMVAMFVIIGSFATACSGGGNPCEVPEESANPDGISVGVAFDIGGIGDKSFNDAAKAGFDQAVADGLVREASCLEPDESGSNRDENLLALADDGFDLVIGVGFAFSPAVNANAGSSLRAGTMRQPIRASFAGMSRTLARLPSRSASRSSDQGRNADNVRVSSSLTSPAT